MKCNVMRQSATWLQQHSAKRMRDCRQNIPRLLWNALLTTPYVSEHYKYMFVVARDLYEISYFIEENIQPGTQQSAFEVKYEYIVRRSTNIPWAGGLHLGKFPDNRRLMCCALLKHTTAIIQAGFGSQTIRSGTVAFKTLRCVMEVAYICISKSNYRKISCLGEHNTQGTSTPWVNKQDNYTICL